jgi:hypothetical protein
VEYHLNVLVKGSSEMLFESVLFIRCKTYKENYTADTTDCAISLTELLLGVCI